MSTDISFNKDNCTWANYFILDITEIHISCSFSSMNYKKESWDRSGEKGPGDLMSPNHCLR